MNLSNDELDLIRQWYNAVNDLNPSYLGKPDAILYVKIMENLELKPCRRDIYAGELKDYFWLQCDKGKISVPPKYWNELQAIAYSYFSSDASTISEPPLSAILEKLEKASIPFSVYSFRQ